MRKRMWRVERCKVIVCASLAAAAVFGPSQLTLAQNRSARPFEDPRGASTATAKPTKSMVDSRRVKKSWSVTMADGSRITNLDLRGRATLLVFNRGTECPHCRQQLDSIAAHRNDFKLRNIRIVAISPFLPSLDTRPLTNSWYRVAADNDLAAFRYFGFADDNNIPTHGLVLMDPSGRILLSESKTTARVDIEKVLAECDRRLREAAASETSGSN